MPTTTTERSFLIRSRDFEAAYLALYHTGELHQRAAADAEAADDMGVEAVVVRASSSSSK